MALPSVNFICNYNAKNNNGGSTIYHTDGQELYADLSVYEGNFNYDDATGYYWCSGDVNKVFDFYSSDSNPFSFYSARTKTFVFKVDGNASGPLFSVNTENYDLIKEYVIYQDHINIVGEDFYYPDAMNGNITSIVIDGTNNNMIIRSHYDDSGYNYSETVESINLPSNYIGKAAFFTEDADIPHHNKFYGGFYWFYSTNNQLTDSDIADVINFNEYFTQHYLTADLWGEYYNIPSSGGTYYGQVDSSSNWWLVSWTDGKGSAEPFATLTPQQGSDGITSITVVVPANTGESRFINYTIQNYDGDNAYFGITQQSGSPTPTVDSKLYLGSNKINKFYFGSNQVDKIYLGSTIVYEKSAPATITGISFTITAVNDAPASGGTISSADCIYTATANYSDGTTSDVTSQASISGYLLVESSYNTTRHSVGNLALTASYDSYSASASTTVYQAAYVPTESYLEFNITSGGTIYWFKGANVTSKTIEYSLNGGSWTSLASAANSSTTDTNTITVVSGDKVRFRGDNSTYCVGTSMAYANRLITTATFEVYGNIMSLINSSSFANLTSFTDNYALLGLFYQQTGLTSASGMVLPATTLVERCYQSMFNGCTSLTTAPELPATTLANACYNSMFQNCSSLTTAPDLLAATLQTNCYYHLFYGCSSLTYIKCTCTTIPSGTSYTNAWTNGVASSGTFVKKSSTTWQSGANGIPSGWTIEYDT